MLKYNISADVVAFTAGKGAHGTAFGVDARETGVEEGDFCLPSNRLFIPRQTHSVNVVWTDVPGELPDADAAITRVPGLCVAVKTADCIPVLLYDERQRLVAAVHAGWRGTVGRIVERTIQEMQSRGEDIHAVIGPGISLDSFEVGDEVYEAFFVAGFPMERIAKRYPVLNPQPTTHNSQTTTPSISNSSPSTSHFSLREATKWHLDLFDANRWVLEQCGVTRIHTDGTCTYKNCDQFYSARRETIKTGRNINGIMMPLR